MAGNPKLPSNENQWNTWTARHGVSGVTIHDATLTSASTISEKQYLLLQVLWISLPAIRLDLRTFHLETWKQQADELLIKFQSWANYRQSFTNDHILEGTSNVTFSPVASRTRGKISSLERKLREAQLQTPTKSTGNLPGSPEVGDTPDNRDSPFQSPGPQEIANLMYPQTKDEQIVNTALVDFLNALSMHFPEANDWTLHRKSFKAEFEHASFEARTDGYLEDGQSSDKVRALIEVKPMTRRKRRNPICMQEAAQMAAWIKSDPDVGGALNLPGRRLHVSQDRHQIFLIFAEYTEDYWLFKQDATGELSAILLAIALRGHHDANQGSVEQRTSANPSTDIEPEEDTEQPV
ncbi:hypothetical protein BO78DRAFT_426099 [Aspergillus sclerotiicarbonarius CBS 121057]|uniref:Uncharacterized protein n=1 Tax=Aspergillus sclerotiicarbonarius (strain CBS 121057 / IBT 28362) TaxID=1448318 RepID=A0A319EL62_ASPSB|nr:hypothetical protein BO78DRAFT_426099 [Aspergillus sclerotiicarbonarius CBS 121057]